MSRSLMSKLLRIRARLIPEELQLGWMPIFTLGYLAFLFMPLLFSYSGSLKMSGFPITELWPTLLSIAIFLPIYFKSYRCRGLQSEIFCVLGMAALGYALLPFNVYSNTYLIYAGAFTAFIKAGLLRKFIGVLVMLGVFLLELVWFGTPIFVFALTATITLAVFFSNHFYHENARKRAALKLSHDEVRRLAALAERERIGRDLHDLLGHTLSLIALKSELAGKLIDRDIAAARHEVDEVTRVARDALAQVRRAVSGIRAAGLAAELASARQLLESDGISFDYSLGEVEISVEQETVLALVVREAITNIQRHARARKASVIVESRKGDLHLRIEDDGRGSAIVAGNGLKGMRERVEALGGRLRIDSVRGKGTRLEVDMELTESTLTLAVSTAQSSLASH
ncbi:MAG TPA: sensor histidine kinase [Dokdonella sp.]|uniref:sensor histidine kinase n=1 Tax=Dokdonella sp. TaxID=2291710 RepID=UPI002D8015B7|nr:sensor histidine kinase [Dokdonella sp.]HET9031833.1 sensor histidine kinase [Dokdonella sp.]